MPRISSLAVVSALFCYSAAARGAAPAATAHAAIPSTTTSQIQQAVDRATKYLQAESAGWLKTRKCAACHHAPLALWSLGEADRRGYTVDKKFVTETTESLLGSKDKLLASRIFPNPADRPDPRPQGRGLNMGLPMLAVAAQSLSPLTEGQRQSLKLIAQEIVKKQQSDGSWEFFATLRRPPINESQTTDVAWNILALQGMAGSDPTNKGREALSKAVAWLDAAKRDLHQDKVFKLLLAVRFGKPRESMQTAIDELLALQRADGGWSQTVPEPRSDAFATGQTLYVLSLAGYTADRPEIKRGIEFLVATQKPDGSWPMISRSTPDGRPGSAKLLTPITCAAGSWATLALASLVPGPKSVANRNAMKIPTKIAGEYRGGELVELRVRDRLAYLIKPTGKVDPEKRWLWEFPRLSNVVAAPTKELDYGLSLAELERRAGEFNPIDNLAPLARAGVKILHLHGDRDTLVPTETRRFTPRFLQTSDGEPRSRSAKRRPGQHDRGVNGERQQEIPGPTERPQEQFNPDPQRS